ncbi:sensor histidine kinase [Actinokineospora sp. HUAS TT18]|uniref:sensor histidine kinase n=1 Tax=Actinokineospora sp. HUAS TT18 TaxID=3447451 RepID=UPI003F528AB9
MRRRLLLVLLLFSTAAVAAFAVPLLFSTAEERTQRFVISRTADLDRFATLSGDALRAEVVRYTELYGEEVVVVDARRAPVVESGLRAADPALAPVIDAALRNQPAAPVATVLPWTGGDVLFARPVGTGTKVAGAVVVRASTAAVAADVTRGWAWVLTGALAAAALGVAVTFVVARWLLRPLRELERGVLAVTAGERGAHVAGGGPTELRALAESFNRMSDAVTEAADQQRRLIADTSHQLRNPLAALRLRVDLRADDEATAAEVDRLETLLDGMLALATAEHKATERAAGAEVRRADLGAMLLDRVDAWRPAADRAGVRLSVETGEPVSVAADLAQVLDVLLDNGIKYGAQTVHIRQEGGSVVVSDDGPGIAEADLGRATDRFWRGSAGKGTGLGLAIADRLVAAHGGTLRLASVRPHGLAVHLDLR